MPPDLDDDADLPTSWLESFDGDRGGADRLSALPIRSGNVLGGYTLVPTILALPPPEEPEQTPSDCENLSLPSISSVETPSLVESDGTTPSVEWTIVREYRELVSEARFRVDRLRSNKVFLHETYDNPPADVAAVVDQIRSHDNEPVDEKEHREIQALTWGVQPPRKALEGGERQEEIGRVMDPKWKKVVKQIRGEGNDENLFVKEDEDEDQEEMGIALADGAVSKTFNKVLWDPLLKIGDGDFEMANGQLVNRAAALPSIDTSEQRKLPRPIPDAIFGFPCTFLSNYPTGEAKTARATASVNFPFFVMEYSDCGVTRTETPWVTTNRCILSCVTCSNIAGQLNELLRRKNQPLITTTAFGALTNGSETRLFVSWQECKETYNRFIICPLDDWLLRRPEDWQQFRGYTIQIFAWAKRRQDALKSSIASIYMAETLRATPRVQDSMDPIEEEEEEEEGVIDPMTRKLATKLQQAYLKRNKGSKSLKALAVRLRDRVQKSSARSRTPRKR